MNRRGQVIGIVFVGALAAIVVPFLFLPDATILGVCLAFGLDLVVASAALAFLGRGAWRQAVGRIPDARAMLLAVAAAAVTSVIAYGYVALLALLAPEGAQAEFDAEADAGWAFVIAAVAFAPVAEEMLCRGALWAAIRPVTGRGTAIVVTAVVFGMLHGLNGAHFLEVPHRFAIGCVLGWLRATTGSLTPCIAAHALHNAMAVAME